MLTIDIPASELVPGIVSSSTDVEVLEIIQALELSMGDWQFTREILLWAADLENEFRKEFPRENYEHFLLTGELKELEDDIF